MGTTSVKTLLFRFRKVLFKRPLFLIFKNVDHLRGPTYGLPVPSLRPTAYSHVWLVACGYNCVPTSIPLKQSEKISGGEPASLNPYLLKIDLLISTFAPSYILKKSREIPHSKP